MRKCKYDHSLIIEKYKSGLSALEVASFLEMKYNAVYDILHASKVLRERGGISVIDGTKKCSACKDVFTVNQFDTAKTQCGYRPDCKVCRAKREKLTRIRYNSRPEEEKKAILEKNRLIKLRYPERLLHRLARSRAKKKGLPFNIEVSDVVIPILCPVLNIPLSFNEKAVGPNSPTLDRIINLDGYVKGNVQVISWQANKLKSNATIEQLELLLTYLKSLSYV